MGTRPVFASFLAKSYILWTCERAWNTVYKKRARWDFDPLPPLFTSPHPRIPPPVAGQLVAHARGWCWNEKYERYELSPESQKACFANLRSTEKTLSFLSIRAHIMRTRAPQRARQARRPTQMAARPARAAGGYLTRSGYSS